MFSKPISQSSSTLTFLNFDIGSQSDYIVSILTELVQIHVTLLVNAWILSKLYMDIVHMIFLDISVTIQTRSRLTCLVSVVTF